MYIDQVKEKITEQQKELEGTPAFEVGEQLKEICSTSERVAEIVLQDLNNPGMSIRDVEGQLRKYADQHHGKSNCFCITPGVAEEIIKKFYGIDGIDVPSTEVKADEPFINLEDFIG